MAKTKKEEKTVRCIECERCALFQWDDNPVIAACNKGERDVATVQRRCQHFIKASVLPKPIKHLTHYR